MIGIDISGRSIKIVEAADGDERALKTLCWSSLGLGVIKRGVIKEVEAVAIALTKTMASCLPVPLDGQDVVASIPEVQSFVRVLELPLMAESEIDEAVQWAIKRHIPFDLDRVYIDWELLPGQENTGRYQVLVGAAQRSVVDPLLAVLDSFNFNVVALELEAQAVIRCLLPQAEAESRQIRGVLLVDLGGTSTNVVFYDQGAMRYTASIQSGGDDLSQRLVDGLSISANEAIEMKAVTDLAAGEADAPARILREGATALANNVAGIVRELSVQLPAERRVRAVLLSGGGANLKGMIEVFAEVFTDLPIQLGNPWTNLQRADKINGANLSYADALHFTTAIGLALRPDGLARPL